MSNETKKVLVELLHRRFVKFVKSIDFAYRGRANVWTKVRRPQKGQILKSYMTPSVLQQKNIN